MRLPSLRRLALLPQLRPLLTNLLHRELGDIPDLAVLLQHLHNGRLRDRNRAMVVLATHRKIPSKTICAFLGVAKAFVLKYRNKFKTSGTAAIFAPQTKSNRKIDDSDLRNAVFGLLHEPPTNHGINRTSWTMPLLSRVLKENGRQIGTAVMEMARINQLEGFSLPTTHISVLIVCTAVALDHTSVGHCHASERCSPQ
jgi:hypothetical protein